ncbi:hypothetical protein GRAN_2705 [Granulicella sibirica]|uniref:Uncharacterized protein n=1 Tax=Granulicella sibirica TaxID=2479048 RepID=A0A4Q0T1K2_9BACT|nr:hypothetical protein GRAN_2705 [Granulicella sibirica]
MAAGEFADDLRAVVVSGGFACGEEDMRIGRYADLGSLAWGILDRRSPGEQEFSGCARRFRLTKK